MAPDSKLIATIFSISFKKVKKIRTLGGEHTKRDAGDVSLGCTLETCTVLLINVTPINPIKNQRLKRISVCMSIQYRQKWINLLEKPWAI